MPPTSPACPRAADVFEVLRAQPDQLRAMLQSTWDDQASRRPKPGEWSIKEVIGHICDQERVFAYRLMRIARGDKTPLPGFDQDVAVNGTDFGARDLAGLIDEFDLPAPRQPALLRGPRRRRAIAAPAPPTSSTVTPRALLYLMAGHVMHHIESLQVDYNVAGAP